MFFGRTGDLWCVRSNLMKGKSRLQQPIETSIEDPGNNMVLEQRSESSRLEKLEADLARRNRVEDHRFTQLREMVASMEAQMTTLLVDRPESSSQVNRSTTPLENRDLSDSTAMKFHMIQLQANSTNFQVSCNSC